MSTASPSLADRIDALLPQTQCRQCGHDGCRPYAEALAAGDADVNQCPPGGEPTIRALARLLDRDFRPLDRSRGETRPRALAVIDEQACIGCTLCIQACPVDAILGAAKLMHTVISDECTGCELCVAPCPVDCIDMMPMEAQATGWSYETASGADRHRANRARLRFQSRNARLAHLRKERSTRKGRRLPDMAEFRALPVEERRRILAQAISRARTKDASR